MRRSVRPRGVGPAHHAASANSARRYVVEVAQARPAAMWRRPESARRPDRGPGPTGHASGTRRHPPHGPSRPRRAQSGCDCDCGCGFGRARRARSDADGPALAHRAARTAAQRPARAGRAAGDQRAKGGSSGVQAGDSVDLLGVNDAVEQAIGIISQHGHRALDHHWLQRVANRCLGAHFNQTFRAGRGAEVATGRHR